MQPIGVWKNRIQKFIDHPTSLIYFIKRIGYDYFVADTYVPLYQQITFLTPEETLNHIIDTNSSIIRFGDGEFGLIRGASVYFNDWRQKYSKELKNGLIRSLSSNSTSILICLPEQFLVKTKQDLEREGKGDEYAYWINSKMIFHKYLHKKKVYGSSFAFYPAINTAINYTKLKDYFNSKHVVIITSNTKRFEAIELGITTNLIEAPKSDGWDKVEEMKEALEICIKEKNLPMKDILVMVSMGSAAKVMVHDLAVQGYTAWDAGQFFDLAYKKIKELSI